MNGQTPLQSAASVWCPRVDVAELLLEAGAPLGLLSAVGLGRRADVIALAPQVHRHPEILCPVVAAISVAVGQGRAEGAVLAAQYRLPLVEAWLRNQGAKD